MTLEPTDKEHEAQIKAGIEGRKKGHDFEEALAEDINRITVSEEYFDNNVSHLTQGRPSEEILKYIISNEGISEVVDVKAFWLGGIATMDRDMDLGDINTDSLSGSKSDVVVRLVLQDGESVDIGVSVKTCHKSKPTNAQLYCTTAQAFCEMLRRNDISVSQSAEKALRMFCGEEGYRPKDDPEAMDGRKADDRRWFWEELPEDARNELENLLDNKQKDITKILLQDAYENDPYPPKYVLHQRVGCDDINDCKMALFEVDELSQYSEQFNGFYTYNYGVHKGTFKDDPNTHQAPRFGFVQFQRLGNTQNATQLQYNLKTAYFNKIDDLT
jgi:hypothetical protein